MSTHGRSAAQYADAGAAMESCSERASGLRSNLQGLRKCRRLADGRVFRELSTAYPSAKFVLTHRSPESWVESFLETIYKLLAGRDKAPTEMQAWLEMAVGVINKTGFPGGLDVAGLTKAYIAHNNAVMAAIPANKMLVYQVKDGWDPLCSFLDVPVPVAAFPRTNDRGEFWDRVSGKK
jgi:hypothetical protein